MPQNEHVLIIYDGQYGKRHSLCYYSSTEQIGSQGGEGNCDAQSVGLMIGRGDDAKRNQCDAWMGEYEKADCQDDGVGHQ